jgi:hypothetical protein
MGMREIKFRFHCAGHGMTQAFTLQELLSGKAKKDFVSTIIK